MSKTNFFLDREKLEVSMQRVFDAPRELVWKAHTDPILIAKWWGPRKYETIVEKLDPRVGGKWKFINRADGQAHIFYGEFREVHEPEKIVWTFTYAPYPQFIAVETLQFEELPDGKTKLSTVAKYPSHEAFEAVAASGMEEGAIETWDRLSELLEIDT